MEEDNPEIIALTENIDRTPSPLRRSSVQFKVNGVDRTTSCKLKRNASKSASKGKLQRGRRWARSIYSKRLKMLVSARHGEDEEEVTLMYAQHESVPMKDFHSEVRATLDIEQFLSQAVLLLDVSENVLQEVIDLLLNKTLTFLDEPQTVISEARGSLFTHDSVQTLAKTIQGVSTGQGFDYDQSWICVLCNCMSLTRRHVAIARLKHPANFGRTSQEVRFVILILAPTKEKGTKNALETGRTFATIFADIDFRQNLLGARTEEEFKKILNKHTQDLAEEQSRHKKRLTTSKPCGEEEEDEDKGCRFAGGLRDDVMRRLPHYLSDYKDGIVGHRTPQKVFATTIFLYFACILPAIAFGVLNDKNTHGMIDVKKVIFSQAVGGLFFSLFGGQPLIILLTTAPLALYIKIIYSVAEDFDLDFFSVYACVGIWNSCFLILYSLTGASKLMKWSTRSTEEIFAVFIAIAFCVDALKELAHDFQQNYNSAACACDSPSCIANLTAAVVNATGDVTLTCQRESSILYLLLLLGTVWLGLTLFNFTKSPFLDANKREMLADYALPVAVITMSFIGSFIFKSIQLHQFDYSEGNLLVAAPLDKLSASAIAGCAAIGFPLSLLFFMDQNISSALVNAPLNKLKKGPAYHLDLFVVALLNMFLSVFGLPWVHAALPHSPLHVRALADVEERVDQGHVQTIIVRVRETRLTAIFSHVMIALSMLMLPIPLQYIPQAVLYGLFLYVAFTSVDGNQLFDRILLLFTEQAAYPPNHYVRRVPQRKIHTFTTVQLAQLATLCAFGFAPLAYLKMVFPILLLFLLPVRHKLVPKIIAGKYLEALDRAH
ncbi:solute carrier family 4 member 11-like isoform X2 [Ptychodera flava]|uniref:solute carrier family 4 member 11-like isoform X2 n=1 Tax=Ptychodera flava TaxID=63121 RepID=UPI00396A1CCA